MLCAFLPLGRGRVGLAKLPPPCLRGGGRKQDQRPMECVKYLGGGGVPKERKGENGLGGKRKSLPRFLGGTGEQAGREGAGT